MSLSERTLTAAQASGIDALRTVHNSVYSPRAFELERERIFRRLWCFVCHESELPGPGHFLTTELAGDPVVLTRRLSGELAAYHNVCRHRGCLVVEAAHGVAGRFQCPYHHWTYSLDGALVSVPGEAAYEGSGFAREHFGLVPVRVENVCGLVFACLDPDAPTLAEFLGPQILTVLERPLGRARYEVFRQDAWLLQANWKMFAENGRDGYHVPFVHTTFLGRGSPPQPYTLFERTGHALQQIAWARDAVDDATWADTARFELPGFAPGEGWLINVFPDLVVTARSNVAEILSQVPLAADQTRYEVRVLGLADDTPEQRAVRQRSFEVWLATQQPEDQRIMELQQRGLRSQSVRTSIIARGADALEGIRGDDNRLRQFWTTWRALLGLPANAVPDA
jgi:phenylpropionate dioxygenase-like ring-hydroxylating dioxygenase large terminal subunit